MFGVSVSKSVHYLFTKTAGLTLLAAILLATPSAAEKIAATYQIAGTTNNVIAIYDTTNNSLEVLQTLRNAVPTELTYVEETNSVVATVLDFSSQQNLIYVVDATSGRLISRNVAPEDLRQLAAINPSVGQMQTGGTQIEENAAAIAGNAARITENRSLIDRNAERIEQNTEGIAMAMALGGGASIAGNETVAIEPSMGFYEGKTAFGVSGALRMSENLVARGGIAYGAESESVGGRVSLRLGW